VTLGIVIVTYKCRDLALRCLDSIATQLPEVLPHTVIVDNASGDGTAEAVRLAHPAVTVIENEKNLGFATAVNRGIAALPGASAICLLNPDSVLLDANLPEAVAFVEVHREVGVLGGRIVNDDGSIQPSARAFPSYLNSLFNRHSLLTKLFPNNRWSQRYLMTDWAHDEVRPVDWVSGAFMLIHRRAIHAAGVLDPAYFFSIEDVDYCRRVRDAGLEVMYFPGTTVRHRVGGSSRHAVIRARAAHHRGMWRYYRKHKRTNPALDALTLAAIWGRFTLHTILYSAGRIGARLLRTLRGHP
jgi:GT2 family glycosyltransferase